MRKIFRMISMIHNRAKRDAPSAQPAGWRAGATKKLRWSQALAIFCLYFAIAPLHAAPVIATKDYVDSGLTYTKNYVDGMAATNGGFVPSLDTLKAASWDNAHWGTAWEAKSNDGAYKINGVGACLSSATKSNGVPSASTYGANCWCKVSAVNDTAFSGGAWVFLYTPGSYGDCFAHCAFNCSYCVRYGTNVSCSRAALFAAP